MFITTKGKKVKHITFLLPFLLLMSCNRIVKFSNYVWIWFISTAFSPLGEASNFMAISRTSLNVAIFCCVSCSLIGVRNAGMNHFLCWMSFISKLTLSISVLNLWSKSQTVMLIYCLISFDSLMYSASEFFNKSSTKLC